MKKFLISLIFIFLFFNGCTKNSIGLHEKKKIDKFDASKITSFEEYIKLLSLIGKYKQYPDINDFPK